MLLRDTTVVDKKNNAEYKQVVLAMLMPIFIKVDRLNSAAKVWMDLAIEELLMGDASLEEQELGK